MTQVSRPMQMALAAVVLFAAVWFVALRPKPATSGGAATPAATSTPSTSSAPGVTGLTNAINKAHGAVSTSQANADRLQGASGSASGDTPTTSSATPSTGAATPSAATHTPSATTPAATTKAATHPVGKHATATHAKPLKVVAAPPKAGAAKAAWALKHHKVLAVLFYNPSGADDAAVHTAFRHQKTHGGRVVLIAASLDRLASFSAVTAKAAVTASPTLIIFDRKGNPSPFTGFLDPTEIANHIDDALAGVKKPAS